MCATSSSSLSSSLPSSLSCRVTPQQLSSLRVWACVNVSSRPTVTIDACKHDRENRSRKVRLVAHVCTRSRRYTRDPNRVNREMKISREGGGFRSCILHFFQSTRYGDDSNCIYSTDSIFSSLIVAASFKIASIQLGCSHGGCLLTRCLDRTRERSEKQA